MDWVMGLLFLAANLLHGWWQGWHAWHGACGLAGRHHAGKGYKGTRQPFCPAIKGNSIFSAALGKCKQMYDLNCKNWIIL